MANNPTRVFPSSHPFVKNEDGSVSNVKLATFGFGDEKNPKYFVVPTMVNGYQLSNDDALTIAKQYGIARYPSFKTQESADEWAKSSHDKIDENGFLIQKDSK